MRGLQQAVARDSTHLEALLALGDVQLRQGDPMAAATAFARGATVDSASFAAAYGQGRAHWKSGALADAVAPLQRALYLDPEHVAAHYALGVVNVRLQHFADARASFARCTALDAAHLEAHYGRDHPEVAITLSNLGNAYGDLGDAKGKKARLERALGS